MRRQRDARRSRCCGAASGATATDVVKAAGCSSSLLERYFRKTIGRTIVQELQRVRLEKACDLLLHSETPIGEIGPLCGYKDEIHFAKLFKKAYGVSMRGWRGASAQRRFPRSFHS